MGNDNSEQPFCAQGLSWGGLGLEHSSPSGIEAKLAHLCADEGCQIEAAIPVRVPRGGAGVSTLKECRLDKVLRPPASGSGRLR